MIKYAKENLAHKIDDILRNQEIGNLCKTFWQVMGQLIGKTSTSINILPLLKQDNTFERTDFEKAEELNPNFATISTTVDANTNLPNLNKVVM